MVGAKGLDGRQAERWCSVGDFDWIGYNYAHTVSRFISAIDSGLRRLHAAYVDEDGEVDGHALI